MKVTDIIPNDSERKTIRIANHLKRKKKANPKLSTNTPMTDFIDVFGGTAGTDTGSENSRGKNG